MNSQLQFFIEFQKYDLRLFEILDKKKKALALIKAAQGPVLAVSKQLEGVQEAGAVLEILEQVKENEREEKDLKIKAGKVAQAFAHTKEKLKSEIPSLEQELSVLEEQHGELTKRMGPALLARYTKLKSLRKGLAIAKMQDGTCLGCRLQLPPQLVAEVKRTDELLHCVYCHRILFWESVTGAGIDAQSSSGIESVPELG